MARKLNMACWVPVDHEPAPPRVTDFFRESGAIPIAMSKFGARMLEEFDPLYVPHGIDTTVYKPIDKKTAREVTQMPQDKWLVGMVAANKGNPSRKCFAEALMAFKKLADGNPDVGLYLHTEAQGIFNGVDLPRLIREIGIPGDRVYLSDQERLLFNPVGHETMAHVYSSLDCLLSPSAGEGFGIPVLEANACGVPAIVTDFSAQSEVCGAGWKVGYSRYWTTQSSWQAHPDVDDITQALKAAHRRTDREIEAMEQQAREHALAYDVDAVMENHMLPALEQCAARFKAREPSLVKA
jgi:glycosyltransferase involved in cell wall biosynthesis